MFAGGGISMLLVVWDVIRGCCLCAEAIVAERSDWKAGEEMTILVPLKALTSGKGVAKLS